MKSVEDVTNCPNCGAPIEGAKCSYCGALLLDLADLEIGMPSFVRIKYKNVIRMFRVLPKDVRLEMDTNSLDYYADNTKYRVLRNDTGTLNLKMEILEDCDGVYMRAKRIEK